MKTLRLHISDGSRATVLVFPRFPILIGRDPKADCRLEYPFVSRRHAQIDLRDGKLVVVDEGSRMGTWVLGRRRRVAPGEVVHLEAVGNEISIEGLYLRAELHDVAEADDTERNATAAVNSATCCYADANIDPGLLDADAIEAALIDALAAQQRAGEALADVLRQATASSPGHVERFARRIVEADAEWDGRAVVRRFVAASGIHAAPSRVGATALRVLQELSSTYVPYAPPLSGVEAVTDFVARLDAVLGVLFEGMASLRYSYQCESGSPPRGDPDRADLAAGLLDWTNDGKSIDEMRQDFGRMLVHHSRVVDEATAGLLRLLDRLSPVAIEAQPGCRSKWTPWRYKARWLEFVRRVHVLGRDREGALGPALLSAASALRGTDRARRWDRDGLAAGRPCPVPA